MHVLRPDGPCPSSPSESWMARNEPSPSASPPIGGRARVFPLPPRRSTRGCATGRRTGGRRGRERRRRIGDVVVCRGRHDSERRRLGAPSGCSPAFRRLVAERTPDRDASSSPAARRGRAPIRLRADVVCRSGRHRPPLRPCRDRPGPSRPPGGRRHAAGLRPGPPDGGRDRVLRGARAASGARCRVTARGRSQWRPGASHRRRERLGRPPRTSTVRP
ncbi:hypothetical protein FHR81_001662 [Actinoalloteichus hoggarensis]|nr:hypothetical protein [Actinoalloteichus hoggarensis]